MEQELSDFLSSIFPPGRFEELPQGDWPFALQKDYRFFLYHGARKVMMALALNYRTASEVLMATEIYAKLARPEPLVFLLQSLGESDQVLLRERHVPFLSLEGEVFIPFFDLYRSSPKRRAPQPYDLQSQALAAFYLFAPVGFYPIKAIQTKILLQPSLCSEANRTLFGLGLLRKQGLATAAQYARIHDRAAFLERLYPLLLSPLKATYYTYDPLPQGKIQGAEASLGHYSDLLPQCPGIALSKKEFKALQGIRLYSERERLPGQAYQRIDVFAFGPCYPLDGYLNPLEVIALYQKDPDDRVQEAVREMKERLLHGSLN